MRVYLISLLCSTCLLITAASDEAGNLQRILRLHKGAVTTARSLPQWRAGRGLGEGVGAQDAAGLWLIGMPQDLQASVAEAAKDCGAAILQALPPDHWLIAATAGCVDTLLSFSSEVTAAQLPPAYKVSSSLDPFHQASTTTQAAALRNQAGATTAAAALDAGVDVQPALSEPSLPASADTQTLPDGRVLVTLLIMGLPVVGATKADQRASAAAAAAALQALLSPDLGYTPDDACNPSVTPVGTTGTCEVQVCLPDLGTATHLLSQQPSVQWVDIKLRPALHNIWSGSVMQSGEIKGVPPGYEKYNFSSSQLLEGDPRDAPALRPLWAAGLDGRGQLVGVVDSGLDMDSCYFWDPSVHNFTGKPKSTVLLVDKESGVRYFHHPGHRKVPYYFLATTGGDLIDTMGHGSHVAGTAAGAAYGFDPVKQPDYATGVAPNARIAFYDAENATWSDFNIPTDPAVVFEVLYSKGVRVVANSWGYPGGGYRLPTCNLIDTYLWHRQDLLLVFSAGNEALKQEQSNHDVGTIGSPADCKNVLTVGATESWIASDSRVKNLITKNGTQVSIPLSWMYTDSDLTPLTFKAYNSSGALITTISTVGTYYKDEAPWPHSFARFIGKSIEVVAATADKRTDDGCNKPFPYFNSTKVKGKLVLLTSTDTCYLGAVLPALKKTGALGAIAKYDLVGLGYYFQDDGADAPVPLKMIPTDVFSQLKELLPPKSKGVTPATVVIEVSPQIKTSPYTNTPWFSSYSPFPNASLIWDELQDLRIKPDLTAPGMVRSAKTSKAYEGKMDSCATTVKEGTSMACPGAAAAATLVRQYFMDGFYPTGAAVASDAYLPSAPLIKAVLIAGTVAMTGYSVPDMKPLEPPPSNYQGFGRLHLGRSLPLASSTLGWNLTVVDRAVFNDTSSNHTYTVTATGQGPLIVVLTYIDWPGATPALKGPSLVNNLDLMIEYPGNLNSTVWWGNNAEDGDVYNNVEKVAISRPAPGTYTLTVIPTYLFIVARPQYYSLVVLGGITSTLDSPFNPAYVAPS